MMTPIYMNPPPTNSFPLFELKEDDDQHFKLFMTPHQTASSCPIFCGTSEDQRGIFNNPSDQSQHHEHKVYKHIWHEESSDRQVLPSSSTPPMMDNSKSGLNLSATKGENGGEENKSDNGSVKWMSSKMRLMRKMMNSNCETTDKAARIEQQKYHIDHHKQQHGFTSEINSSENFNITVRICSNCNTTKTPLWRSGPRGPKSLCNACGIRQRKARRAMEAAAAANGGVLIDTKADTSSSSSSTKTNYKGINKDKKSRSGYHLAQYKCEQLQDSPNDHQRKKKLCFEDFALNLLSKNSSFRRVFPQDEEEGAILLMALSCGLV